MRRFRLYTVITVIKALSARALFIVHTLFTIWAATCVSHSAAVWAMMSMFGLFLMETVYSIMKRKGQEPQWFSPCIFLYLLTVVPPIWILNLDMIHCFVSSYEKGNGSCVGLFSDTDGCAIVSLESYFNRKPLAYTLEQVMLLLLILGRWLLPKGNISRQQLSQLLFVYFGFSSDIMDLFYLFEEPAIILSERTTYAILIVWSLSLFQFTIVLTTVKSRSPSLSLKTTPIRRLTACKCCQFEIWGLLATVFMQDGPFLVVRLYCLIGMNVFSYTFIFYTIKNILVVTLQVYRFFVLLLNCRENVDSEIEGSGSGSGTTMTSTMTTMTSISSVSQRKVEPPECKDPPRTRPQLNGGLVISRGTSISVSTLSNTHSYNYSFESVV